MNEKRWENGAAILIASILFVIVILVAVGSIGYAQHQVKIDIENAINVPDGYSIEPVNLFNFKKMDGDWYRYTMWFKNPNYVCTEDEMINEPWKLSLIHI